jgi:hypothetical protein
MLRSCQRGGSKLRVRGRAAALHAFTVLQPKGYRDAHRYVSSPAFVAGCEQLARDYIRCIPEYKRGDIPSLDVIGLYRQWPQLDWRYCPVHVLHDTALLKLPALKIDLFRTVEAIEESRVFLSSLARAPLPIQRAWIKVKQQLATDTAIRGLDFKAWERRKDAVVYSVRLGQNFRAHLERHSLANRWIAVALGSHTRMGHG